MPDNELIDLTTSVPEDYRGLRLDVVLAKCFPEHSRSRLAEWGKQSKVSLNGKVVSGPPPFALAQYQVTVSGTTLTIA